MSCHSTIFYSICFFIIRVGSVLPFVFLAFAAEQVVHVHAEGSAGSLCASGNYSSYITVSPVYASDAEAWQCLRTLLLFPLRGHRKQALVAGVHIEQSVMLSSIIDLTGFAPLGAVTASSTDSVNGGALMTLATAVGAAQPPHLFSMLEFKQ